MNAGSANADCASAGVSPPARQGASFVAQFLGCRQRAAFRAAWLRCDRDRQRLNVVRVSTVTRFATLALGAVDKTARAVLESGSFDAPASEFSYANVQKLFDS